ncbi:MAG TPA: Gfo/Idh/MocA family oxidoreductase [Planctomycetaceae bacterium]|nr:Gfo/Idh/MocA family oxidoreductase [Planctomycetaceae bacterium]
MPGTLICQLALRSWILCTTALLLTVSGALANDEAPKEKPKSAEKVVPLKEAGEFSDHADWVSSVAFSPDGKWLAAGTYQGVRLWDVAEKKDAGTLALKSGFVRSVAFSHDGKVLAAGSYQAVTLWDFETREVKQTLKGHRAYVGGIAFSPDGKWLGTASQDETARIWKLPEGTEVTKFERHRLPVNAIAFSPTEPLVASAAGDDTRTTQPGEVQLWEIETGKVKLTFPEHEKSATCVAFSPDGKRLASGGLDERIRICDAGTTKELLLYEGHSRPIAGLAFSPDGKWIFSACGGRFKGHNEVKVWNSLDGSDKAEGELEERATSVALDLRGKLLATGSYSKSVVLWNVAPYLATEVVAAQADTPASKVPEGRRAGIIGLDTSHAIAFTKDLNNPEAKEDLRGYRVVAAYPKGSPDIESSVSRVPGYIEEMKKLNVEIVDSIDELLKRVDVVFLETNDGRPHLEQALPVLKAKKPMFIDKPVAGTLADAVALYEAARKYESPIFSASSLRYAPGAQALREGKAGDILGCDAYSPCSLEKTHPDLFWYGIHGVESLYTVMRPGCETVSRVSTPDFDLAVGKWSDGRIGTFRGIRKGASGYGGTAFGSKSVEQIGGFGGYRPLLVEIVKFFDTKTTPVADDETLELYTFMEAADESKRQNGAPVALKPLLEKAREEAQKRLAELDK